MGYHIGSFFIPYYGFFITLGVIVASVAGIIQVKIFKKCIDDFILLAAMVGLGSFLGAKMLYLIISWKDINFSEITNPAYFNSLMSGGFVFYGGLIGGVAFMFLCRKMFKTDVFSYASICIPCVPIAHGFGRLGCSVVGCCFGIPFRSVISVTYQESLFAPCNVPLFPVQAVEAVGNFMIAVILFFLH